MQSKLVCQPRRTVAVQTSSAALARHRGDGQGPEVGVGRPGHSHPVSSGEGAEVIVEAVVLLDDDHYVIDFAGPWSTRRLLHRNHVRIGDPSERIYFTLVLLP